MEEIYERGRREREGEKYSVGQVEWYKDIWPLLQRPPLLSWVNVQGEILYLIVFHSKAN